MRASESIAKLAEALSAAQGELENVTKDSLNPHYGKKYADLASVRDTVRPVLAKHGLAVAQLPTTTDRGVALTTRLMHKSGEWLEGDLLLALSKQDMQGMVSAITYARRVSLAAVTGVAPVEDDDDGNAATGKQAEQQPDPQRKAAPSATPSAKPSATPSARPSAKPSAKPANGSAAPADPFGDELTPAGFVDKPY